MVKEKAKGRNGVSFSGRMGSGKNFCADRLSSEASSTALGREAVHPVQLSFGHGVKRLAMFLLGQPCFSEEDKEAEIAPDFEYNVEMAVCRMFVYQDSTKTPKGNKWMKRKFCVDKVEVCTYADMIGIIREGLQTHLPATRGRLLQVLGTDIMRQKVHQDIWVEILRLQIVYYIKRNIKCIVTDARFPNEIRMLAEYEVICVYVETTAPYKGSRDKNHPSETALNGTCMHVIHNDRTPESDAFVEFVLQGKWDRIYDALQRLPIEKVGVNTTA